MKIITTIILLLTLTTSLVAQTNYDRGFNNGYKKGYCHDQGIGCIEPIPPIAPIPKIGESSESYNDGYNRGFEMGLNARKSNDFSSTSTTNRTRYKTAKSEFIDYVYKPNVNLKLLIAKQEAKNHKLRNKLKRQIKMMQENYISLINDGKYDEMIAREKMLEIIPEKYLKYTAAPYTYYYTSLAYLGKYNETGDRTNLSSAYDYALKSKSYGLKINTLLEKIKEEESNKNNTISLNNKNQILAEIQELFQNKEFDNVIIKLKTIEEKIEQGAISDKNTLFYTYYFLSYSHYYKNNLADIIKYTTKAINSSPTKEIGDIYFLRGFSKSNIGDYYGSNSDYDYLIENYKKINYNTNNLATLYNNKGYNLILLKKYKEAEPLVNKAISLDKSTNYIWGTKGELEYYLGNYFDAVNAMSKSIKIKPTANSYYFRGLAEIELGNKVKGCSDLSKAGEMGETKAYAEIKNKCN